MLWVLYRKETYRIWDRNMVPWFKELRNRAKIIWSSFRFETWMRKCRIRKWIQFIFSQELSIKYYPNQVCSYLRRHFNIITRLTQVHKSPFHSSVTHRGFMWGIWFLNSVTLNIFTLPYCGSLSTIDSKRFRIFTKPHSTLDDAMLCRAVRGILRVAVSNVCWFVYLCR
jgi:hypothetical protein